MPTQQELVPLSSLHSGMLLLVIAEPDGLCCYSGAIYWSEPTGMCRDSRKREGNVSGRCGLQEPGASDLFICTRLSDLGSCRGYLCSLCCSQIVFEVGQ